MGGGGEETKMTAKDLMERLDDYIKESIHVAIVEREIGKDQCGPGIGVSRTRLDAKRASLLDAVEELAWRAELP